LEEISEQFYLIKLFTFCFCDNNNTRWRSIMQWKL